MIAGIDLGSRKTGWCCGIGDAIPIAGAWRFDQVDDDLGALGLTLQHHLHALHARFKFTHLINESPLLLQHDVLLTVRKLYGLSMVAATFCKGNGIVYMERDPQALKLALVGTRTADKDQMVAATVALGIALPETDAAGRKDAADAVAAWLIGVRKFAPQHQMRWDQAQAESRGGLI